MGDGEEPNNTLPMNWAHHSNSPEADQQTENNEGPLFGVRTQARRRHAVAFDPLVSHFHSVHAAANPSRPSLPAEGAEYVAPQQYEILNTCWTCK